MAVSISEAHARCCLAFRDLLEAIQHPPSNSEAQISVNDVQEEFNKYMIWAGNVGAGHSGKRYGISLDYRLREASFFKDQVFGILETLTKKITQAASAVRGVTQPEDDAAGSDEDPLSSSASEVDEEEADDSPWDISSNSSAASLRPKQSTSKAANATATPQAASNTDVPSMEVASLLESIKLCINGLYRMPIRKPAPLDRLRDKTLLESSSYQYFDVLYVKDKFPKLDASVATRLGKMITRRRQMLFYRDTHAKNIRTTPDKPKLLLPGIASLELQEVGTGSQIAPNQIGSQAVSLSSAPQSKATTAQIGHIPVEASPVHLDPQALYAPSVAETQTSMVSSYAGREIEIKVPRRPKGANGKESEYFQCPYCQLSKHIATERKWK